MSEVNDFNAVRISLASPNQIRSWSYGEVTKPETINYRTLKPEKDGLFCEKIFGPTKDWECYCGKYKRVRYKGIVCDKCGVEVARAKVRRERMGHIELAAPVSHIWFVKGTPSRIGLLLDKSPRELERVLYFASYIVTEIDEGARTASLEMITEERRSEAERLRQDADDSIGTIQERRTNEIADLERDRDVRLEELESTLNGEREVLDREAAEVRAQLSELAGKVSEEGIRFRDQHVVKPNGTVSPIRREDFEEQYQKEINDLADRRSSGRAQNEEWFESQKALRDATAEREVDEIRRRSDDEGTAIEDEIEAQRREMEDIQRLKLLSEGQYRELQDKYGHYGFFRAGMGAEAIREIIAAIDLEELRESLRSEIASSSGSGQRRKKAIKRLRVVEAFRKSGNRPEWMIFTILPVLPPDLRPMVQLDGGRFATSDLNDLYRRVINRNNRLKRLLELGAPEIIIRNEKRMLQEAVDSLIDNGRRGRAVAGSSNHKLKSLSDMLKGKQGRFRQNLLGKRVDYSGRSVIVVGPLLKLHQCGLPKRMALELFKPFVMRRLVERGFAHNIKSAKRIVERVKPEVWDALEEVVQNHPVLLNRAPTLHRLGIQAFEPVLVDGSAIQIHPLVCSAFNADFDGDQMAVHVPLSAAAQEEARTLMLSVYNLLSPANGEPIVAPTLDMVLGAYYMTVVRPGAKGEGKVFASEDEAQLTYELGAIDLQAEIEVRVRIMPDDEPERIKTSVGRVIFNSILPPKLRYYNDTLDKKRLKQLVGECYREYGTVRTAELADEMKKVGFKFCTRSGLTIAVGDIGERDLIERRDALLAEADQQVAEIDRQYRRGLITDDERYEQTIGVWTDTRKEVTNAVDATLDRFGSVYMMTQSGAKGNIQQLTQMAAMRGLMAAPSGKIIELPIRSSFREGLTTLEYFISTHGARKGLADTAIRTADSGYLTRRLIDVAQDVIVQKEDCGSEDGIWIEARSGEGVVEPLYDRILGRLAATEVVDPNDGSVIADRNQMIDEKVANQIIAAGVKRLKVRSVLVCEARHGVCRACYGRSLARGQLANIGEAVGIIAAESIGEPGTQLTMRTFHTGGVAGADITSGLPRVEELFEARVPKGQAVLSEIEGTIELLREGDSRKIRVISVQTYPYEHVVPAGGEILVSAGESISVGQVLARDGEDEIKAVVAGRTAVESDRITVFFEERDEREYEIPATARVKVHHGDRVLAGQFLTEGAANPQDVLRIQGKDAVQEYMVTEVQKVYRSQGVAINDKHIEVISRQMLRKVKVETSGDTGLLPGDLRDRFAYEDHNAHILAQGGEPATAQTVLLGVTKASLNTESFLAAASFQETTRVLTEAAIQGSVDRLVGLKENVIIGKLIPAGSGMDARRRASLTRARMAAALAGEPLAGGVGVLEAEAVEVDGEAAIGSNEIAAADGGQVLGWPVAREESSDGIGAMTTGDPAELDYDEVDDEDDDEDDGEDDGEGDETGSVDDQLDGADSVE